MKKEKKIKRNKLGRFIKNHKAIGKPFQKGNRITGKFYRFYPFLRSENKTWKLNENEKDKIKKLAELIPATIIANLFKVNRSTILYWINPKIREYYSNYAKEKKPKYQYLYVKGRKREGMKRIKIKIK